MKIDHCLRCRHTPGEKDKYCTNCGAPLINRCTYDGGPLGEPCNKINSKHAVFCADCGSYTTFYKSGLLETAYMENNNHATELENFKHFTNIFFTQ